MRATHNQLLQFQKVNQYLWILIVVQLVKLALIVILEVSQLVKASLIQTVSLFLLRLQVKVNH
ncbi:hypothetical protein SMXD51_00579 [Ligilactobacillus salivarius SMXD51]|uniref:Uncharacterized protein n=1 Tax=Ligilactobacillus salivarius SMXD51 TaxID=1108963 RepID=H7FWZ7_9LACO|nr:hypothetical protein SMXD51_00579 [Ligilactobacillus salivarius SMXD51]